MNLCSFDIGDAEIALGDTIELISSERGSLNTLQQAADTANILTYELLVNITPTAKRKII